MRFHKKFRLGFFVNKGVLFTLLCGAWLASASEVPVVDPSGVLAQTDAFTAGQSFEVALACGSWVRFDLNECDGGTCWTKTLKSTVQNCRADSVDVSTPGSDEVLQTITRADFARWKGNYLRFFIEAETTASSEKKSYLELSRARAHRRDVAGKVFDALSVDLVMHIYQGAKEGFVDLPYTFTLIKGVPYLAQTLDFDNGVSLGAPRFKPLMQLLEFGPNLP